MLVYGRNVAKEVLQNPKKVKKVTLLKDFKEKDILSLIEKNKIKVEYLDKKGFSKFDKYSHQGIILDIEDFSYTDYEEFLSVENAKIVIENLEVEIECEKCGFKGVADIDDEDHYAPMVYCPECANPRIKILNGKDVTVKTISIEKEDD